MPFTPQHFGLYFSPLHVEQARKARRTPPTSTAWELLLEREQAGVQEAQWCALRYRFDDDKTAGRSAIELLLRAAEAPLNPDMTYMHALTEMLTAAHTFEMVRDHSSFTVTGLAAWRDAFRARVGQIDTLAYERSYVEGLWTALLKLVAGIVLEDETPFTAGVEAFQQAVREDIHPQGHIQRAVEGEDGGSLYRQLLATEALVLMAEAAVHAGVNLWQYSFRGVSVTTACAYPLYYYYMPEKWRWDAGLTEATVRRLFQQHGGYLEMVNRRVQFHDLQPILDDLRPIYDAAGGGLTTLTHPLVKRRGLFG
jgi:hypothetical protein